MVRVSITMRCDKSIFWGTAMPGTRFHSFEEGALVTDYNASIDTYIGLHITYMYTQAFSIIDPALWNQLSPSTCSTLLTGEQVPLFVLSRLLSSLWASRF